MKNITRNLMTLVFALFTVQGLSAQQETVILEETFDSELGAFTVEGPNGISADDPLWSNKSGTICVDGYGRVDGPTTSYLVSPEFTLGTKFNTMSFNYMSSYFPEEKIKECMSVAVRLVGGQWEIIQLPNAMNSLDYVSSGDILIPEIYNGKKVQVALRYYTVASNSSGVWTIDFFKVKTRGSVVKEKLDPEISFKLTDLSVTFGEPFNSPVLDNPNQVEVGYTSSNEEVATVDLLSGEVSILSEGVFTITATSVENDEFKSATAAYTVTVLPKEKVDPEISYDVAEFEATLGEEFTAPVLNNPNEVEVGFMSSNVGVATIDLLSAELTLVGAGETVITATSVENKSFLSGTASYKLVIKETQTGIGVVTVEDLETGKVYDLQGRSVLHPTQGIFIVNGTKMYVE